MYSLGLAEAELVAILALGKTNSRLQGVPRTTRNAREKIFDVVPVSGY